MLGTRFNLQGHRGARGLKPENTLPSFEAALDAGVTSIETDLHLTSDGHVVICHDAALSDRFCRCSPQGDGIDPKTQPLIRTLTLAELRGYVADVNPDPIRFPHQEPSPTPLATTFATRQGVHAFGLPTLDDLFTFAEFYAGKLGQQVGKSIDQRSQAARVVFDLELKRVPGRPDRIGDAFVGHAAGLLEKRVLQCIKRHDLLDKTVVRSFDHRSVLAIKKLEPLLYTAVLVAGTAPVLPEELVHRAGATIYCPDANFLDVVQVKQLHAERFRVLPWTVNDPHDWDKLLAWGVDGITTDYPDRLAAVLHDRGIQF